MNMQALIHFVSTLSCAPAGPFNWVGGLGPSSGLSGPKVLVCGEAANAVLCSPGVFLPLTSSSARALLG